MCRNCSIEGIDAVRNMLNRCVFDQEKLRRWHSNAESYKRGWDDKNGCWKDDPFHNEASHGADSFRFLAISLQDARPGMSKQRFRQVKSKCATKNYAKL